MKVALLTPRSDYPLLWRASIKETETITLSLAELSRTWQTAEDTLHILQRLQEKVTSMRPNPNPPPLLVQGLDFALFRPFGASFCTKLQIVVNNMTENPTFRASDDSYNQSFEAEGNGEAVRDRDLSEFATTAEAQNNEQGFAARNTDNFGLDSENLMSTLLEDIGGESMFNGENWFLQDLC